jgi:hypothetical protein
MWNCATLTLSFPTQPEKISEAIFGKDFSNVSNRLSGLFHNKKYFLWALSATTPIKSLWKMLPHLSPKSRARLPQLKKNYLVYKSNRIAISNYSNP